MAQNPFRNHGDDLKITSSEFSQMYNKWFRELTTIEDNLLQKGSEIQDLQNNLQTDAKKIKNLNDNLFAIEVGMESTEGYLNNILKNQSEIDDELTKMQEDVTNLEKPNEEHYEKVSDLFDSIQADLSRMKDEVQDIVQEINEESKFDVSENPLEAIRAVLDNHADALNSLAKTNTELQAKFESLKVDSPHQHLPLNLLNIS